MRSYGTRSASSRSLVDPNELSKELTKNVPSEDWNRSGFDPSAASRAITEILRSQLVEAIARTIKIELPLGIDKTAERAARRLRSDLTPSEVFDHVTEMFSEQGIETILSEASIFDRYGDSIQAAAIFLMITAAGLATGLIVTGAWQNYTIY
jgi:hypothetical protein